MKEFILGGLLGFCLVLIVFGTMYLCWGHF